MRKSGGQGLSVLAAPHSELQCVCSHAACLHCGCEVDGSYLHATHCSAFPPRSAHRGPGVVGQQPVLQPGSSFEYESACPLRADMGSMEGEYEVQVRGSLRAWKAWGSEPGREGLRLVCVLGCMGGERSMQVRV